MPTTIDYFLVPNSPWTYLGHQRLREIAARRGATIRPLVFDLGQVFPISGGLPLAKRAQRQAYRLVELRRFSSHLGIAMNIQPKYFPVNADQASRTLAAVQLHDGDERALDFAGAALRAVWAEERNIADPDTLVALLAEQGLPARRIEDAASPEVAERYQANTARAIELGLFGAPSYLIDGELFWGQDRLEFVDRKLAP
jgi:carboxymethylenebutenolidase